MPKLLPPISVGPFFKGTRFATPPTNPRKVTTGTTYTAKGVAAAPNQITAASSNELGSSIAAAIRDIVPQLNTPTQRLQTWAQMLNDAGVDVSMRATKTPVLGADVYIEPYSQEPVDLDCAEFCWDNIYGGMNAPLTNVLEDILHFFEDGYAVLEKVHERREWTPRRKGGNTKEYIMLKKLGVRPPSTISKINYDDNGGPNGIEQNAIQADGSVKQVKVDIAKLVIFTHGRVGGDLTGKSLLRTAYPHWYYKTHFYKIDAIQKERHGIGVPVAELPPGYKPKDQLAAETMVRNLRTNEEAGVVLPPGYKLTFAELSGNPVDVLASAIHHNLMILLNVMAQFLALGLETSGGGRATGGAQVDIFMKSLRYVAQMICEMINMYVIPELVVYNFPTKNFPRLQVRNIGEARDLQMIAAALANLVHNEIITMDHPTEQWARKLFDAPQKLGLRPTTTPQTNGKVPAPTPTTSASGNTGTNGGQGNVGKPANAAQ